MAVLERPMKKLSFISGLVLIVSIVVACDIERIEAPSILPMDAEHSILTDSCGMATVEFRWFIRAVTDINVPVVRIAVKNIGSEPANPYLKRCMLYLYSVQLSTMGSSLRQKNLLRPEKRLRTLLFLSIFLLSALLKNCN